MRFQHLNRTQQQIITNQKKTVRLQSGALAIFSPTALTPEVRKTISSLGSNVRYLTALDYEHHIFLSEWATAYPSARTIIGVDGLPEKRAASSDSSQHLPRFTHVFTPQNKSSLRIGGGGDGDDGGEFDAEFEYEYIESHANKELVFCHKPSSTLIFADVFFNLPAHEQYSHSGVSPTDGFYTKIFTAFQNTQGQALWQKRFLWYVAVKDREAFGRSARRVLGWQFDRVVPCHGDVIETGGKGVFEKMVAWFVGGK